MVTKYNVLIKTHNIDIHGNITTKWKKMKPTNGTAYRFTQEEAQKYIKPYKLLGYGQYVRMEKCQD